MNKEKIVLGNKTELEYDSINFGGGALVIGFVGGDAAAIEAAFRSAGQTNLEKIQQCDAAGNVQATHERYDMFKAISKTIGATPEDDVVEVMLLQEGELEMKIRHLEENKTVVDGAIKDLGDIVSGMAEAQGISLD